MKGALLAETVTHRQGCTGVDLPDKWMRYFVAGKSYVWRLQKSRAEKIAKSVIFLVEGEDR